MSEKQNKSDQKTDDFELTTTGGYRLDECMSSLQKSIRRGMEKESMYWALEINSRYPDALWKRLIVIVCEDIGDANNQLVQTVCSLCERVIEFRKVNKRPIDECILGYVILQMARSPKSREADDFVNQVMRERRKGWILEVPEWALDKHTKRGKAMGKGAIDFWNDLVLNNEAHPSKYQGWVDGEGDGTHDGSGVSKSEGEQISLLNT